MSTAAKILFAAAVFVGCMPPITNSYPQSDSCTGKVTYDSSQIIQVNRRIPKFYFHIISRLRQDDHAGELCYQIIVVSLEKRDTVQEITSEGIPGFYEPVLDFVDINFDGYADLMLQTDISANGQTNGYSFCVFDSTERKFVYNQGYSDTLGGNTEIDEKTKEVTSGGRGGCAGQCVEYRTYDWIGNSFLLVRRESVGMDPNDPS